MIKELFTDLKTYKLKNIKVGWSDHTCQPSVIYRAFHKFNSHLLEAHIDLDGKGVEFKFKHCWLPSKISEVIYNIQEGLSADGSSNLKPRKKELVERNWRSDPSDGLRPLRKIRP